MAFPTPTIILEAADQALPEIDADLTSATNDWVAATNCSIATTPGTPGLITMTATATGNMAARVRVPVTVGVNYAVVMAALALTTARSWTLTITWLNSSGGTISSVVLGSPYTESTTYWSFAEDGGTGGTVAPAGAVTAYLTVTIESAAASEQHQIAAPGLLAQSSDTQFTTPGYAQPKHQLNVLGMDYAPDGTLWVALPSPGLHQNIGTVSSTYAPGEVQFYSRIPGGSWQHVTGSGFSPAPNVFPGGYTNLAQGVGSWVAQSNCDLIASVQSGVACLGVTAIAAGMAIFGCPAGVAALPMTLFALGWDGLNPATYAPWPALAFSFEVLVPSGYTGAISAVWTFYDDQGNLLYTATTATTTAYTTGAWSALTATGQMPTSSSLTTPPAYAGVALQFASLSAGETVYVASPSISNALAIAAHTPARLFIDAQGYAHMALAPYATGVGTDNPVMILYAYGTPSGAGWSWRVMPVWWTMGAAQMDWSSDITAITGPLIVALRMGSTTYAHLVWGENWAVTASGSGPPVHALWLTVTIPEGGVPSAAPAIDLGAATYIAMDGDQPSNGLDLDFAHTGDGKSPSGQPDLFITGYDGGLVLLKAVWTGAGWAPSTWQNTDIGPYAAASPVYLGSSAGWYVARVFGRWTGSALLFGILSMDTSQTIAPLWLAGGTRDFANTTTTVIWGTGGLSSGTEVYASAGAMPMVGPEVSLDSAGNIYFFGAAYGYGATQEGSLAYTNVPGSATPSPWWASYNLATRTWGSVSVGPLSFPNGRAATPPHCYGGADSHEVLEVVWWSINGLLYDDLLLTINNPPWAPALLSPGNGAMADFTTALTFSWAFSDPDPGDTQSAWAFRRLPLGGGSYMYWSVASGAWVSSPVWNSGNTGTYQFPASAWGSNGYDFLWSVACEDSFGAQGPFASDLVIQGAVGPSASLTAPSGTVTNDQPTVAWSFSSPQGYLQTAYQIRVFTAAQTGVPGFNPATSAATWDSGVVNSAATSDEIGAVLANGGSYYCYLQVTQQGGGQSGWVSTTFTISVVAPPVPSLTATFTSATASVALAVAGGTGTPAAQTFWVQRSTDQVTWTTVRGASALAAVSNAASVTDYEAPPNQTVYYRAAAQVPGATSAASAVVSVSTTVRSWWLKDPLAPANNYPVHVMNPGSQGIGLGIGQLTSTEQEQQTAYYPLGRTTPLVVAGEMLAAAGQLSIICDAEADYLAVRTLRGAQRTLLLQSAWDQQWYVRLGPDMKVIPGPGGLFELDLTWVEVDIP